MLVKVVFSAELHELTNETRLVVDLPEGSTVIDLIKSLHKVNKEIPGLLLRNGNLNDNFIIIVNGRDIQWLNGLNTRLHDGDDVLIAPKVFLA
ncbi:MAG: MoaD/ThiS family protein [Vulcanisaeta sp. AZ3]|jgi:molybdopterin synthase sulfur carrier subunit